MYLCVGVYIRWVLLETVGSAVMLVVGKLSKVEMCVTCEYSSHVDSSDAT